MEGSAPRQHCHVVGVVGGERTGRREVHHAQSEFQDQSKLKIFALKLLYSCNNYPRHIFYKPSDNNLSFFSRSSNSILA